VQLLKDIYQDSNIAACLGFKGGTAAFLFYSLDRFSTDLDFDLLDDNKADLVFERVQSIASQYGVIRQATRKRFTLLIVLSYESGATQIKIEINQRSFGSRYEILTYLGISMLVMIQPDMYAHKLMAMYERIGKTSRDIYDVWFFLRHNWPINRQIVEQRSGLPFRSLVGECISKIQNVSDRAILTGLGELLTQAQKDQVKSKLREDTVFLLRLLVE